MNAFTAPRKMPDIGLRKAQFNVWTRFKKLFKDPPKFLAARKALYWSNNSAEILKARDNLIASSPNREKSALAFSDIERVRQERLWPIIEREGKRISISTKTAGEEAPRQITSHKIKELLKLIGWYVGGNRAHMTEDSISVMESASGASYINIEPSLSEALRVGLPPHQLAQLAKELIEMTGELGDKKVLAYFQALPTIIAVIQDTDQIRSLYKFVDAKLEKKGGSQYPFTRHMVAQVLLMIGAAELRDLPKDQIVDTIKGAFEGVGSEQKDLYTRSYKAKQTLFAQFSVAENQLHNWFFLTGFKQ